MSQHPRPPQSFQHLSAQDLRHLETPVVLLDVRTGLEYRWQHIPGAVQLKRRQILDQIPKTQTIVVICLSGHRSLPVAHWLVRQGYASVYNLKGGFWQWWRAQYPTTSGRQP